MRAALLSTVALAATSAQAARIRTTSPENKSTQSRSELVTHILKVQAAETTEPVPIATKTTCSSITIVYSAQIAPITAEPKTRNWSTHAFTTCHPISAPLDHEQLDDGLPDDYSLSDGEEDDIHQKDHIPEPGGDEVEHSSDAAQSENAKKSGKLPSVVDLRALNWRFLLTFFGAQAMIW